MPLRGMACDGCGDAMSSSHEVYYFGCIGDAGHYLWSTYGRLSGRKTLTPWGLAELDGGLLAKGDRTEGIVRLHRRDGWTAIAFWDRSCDSRPGSNSAFIARGDLTGEEMLSLFETSFPSVWARITARFALKLQQEMP